jgi:hypothetical protein
VGAALALSGVAALAVRLPPLEEHRYDGA